jgi:hypothetical protein
VVAATRADFDRFVRRGRPLDEWYGRLAAEP